MSVCYARRRVTRVVFLTDRSPAEALPAVGTLGLDVKTEPLSEESLPHLADQMPAAAFVDAVPDPGQAFRVLRALADHRPRVPAVAVLRPSDAGGWPWHEVVEDLVSPGAPAGEVRLRLDLLARRTDGEDGSVLRLGPLAINGETYQVSVSGRVLDLTYKEFELLRFLVQHAGRVFTRSELLQQVWGYDFYGGTRTVDVHVRRLRAKLEPEHDRLIETVRGVGYRAADPDEEGS